MLLLRFLAASILCKGKWGIANATPNIVLILTDEHGWSQLSVHMDPKVKFSKSDYLETPHMPRMMNQGRCFTSRYSQVQLCTPTRRSIPCGTTAARSGTEFASTHWIPADHLTIPKALKRANPKYRMAHYGKWGGADTWSFARPFIFRERGARRPQIGYGAPKLIDIPTT